jgi:transposase
MERSRYQTDLTNDEWIFIEEHLPAQPQRGRPRTYPRQELMNGIFYVARTGCQWRMLPHDLPPWTSVYQFFRKLRRLGLWEKINRALGAQSLLKKSRRRDQCFSRRTISRIIAT